MSYLTKISLTLILVLSLSACLIYKKEYPITAEYSALIEKGDSCQKTGEYDMALTAFQEACALKNQPCPKERIQKIKALNKAYQDHLNEAEEHDQNQEWKQAINSYENALHINPYLAYPRDQINTINKKVDSVDNVRLKKDLCEAECWMTVEEVFILLEKRENTQIIQQYLDEINEITCMDCKAAHEKEYNYIISRFNQQRKEEYAFANAYWEQQQYLFAKIAAEGDHYFAEKKYQAAYLEYEKAQKMECCTHQKDSLIIKMNHLEQLIQGKK